MTISSTYTPDVALAPGGVTTFFFTFDVIAEEHITVEVDDVLISPSNYVVDLDLKTIDFLSAPNGGQIVAIGRLTEATQETDYITGDSFPAETHEEALDKLTLLVQENLNSLTRALLAPISDDGTTDFTLPAYEAGKGLMWHETEKRLTVSDDGLNDIVSAATAAMLAAAASAAAALVSEANASASEDKAELWAQEAEDTPVEPGQFSAFHWAQKALAGALTVESKAIGNIQNPMLHVPLFANLAPTIGNGSVSFIRSGTIREYDRYGDFIVAGNDTPIFGLNGIKLEQSEINHILFSQDFDDATWFKGVGVTVTPNVLNAPDGTLTMDLVTLQPGEIIGQAIAATADTFGAPSFFISKNGQVNNIRLRHNADGSRGDWTIDLSKIGTGIERITRNHPAVTIVTEWQATALGTVTYSFLPATGVVVPVPVHLWGAQFEVDTQVSSSYIWNAFAAIPRPVDTLEITFDGNMQNKSGDMTVLLDIAFNDPEFADEGNTIWSIDNETKRALQIDATGVVGYHDTGTAVTFAAGAPSARARFGYRYQSSTHTLSTFQNGVLLGSTSGLGPITVGGPRKILIGIDAVYHLLGEASGLRVYDIALSDEQMRIA
jgi:hypothetical protein